MNTLDSSPSTSPDSSTSSAPSFPHPLSGVGKLDAGYYAIRLSGLIPLLPAHIPAAGRTHLSPFRLQSERLHPHSESDRTQHLPYHPRNALLLQSLNEAFSAYISSPTEFIPAPRQHTLPPAARLPLSRGISNPTLPYPMAYNSAEFFPLSSLHLPHDLAPGQPINLTDWFVADCLAAAHTYTQLMDATLRDTFGATARFHTYAQALRTDFYPGGQGYNYLMEGIFYPASPSNPYTPDTAHLSLHDVIDAPSGLAHPLPPREKWFRLTAAARPATPEDVGTLGAVRPADPFTGRPAYPYTHFATWVDYQLASPHIAASGYADFGAGLVSTRDGLAHRARSRSRQGNTPAGFSLPYFSTRSYNGWAYKYTDQALALDGPLHQLDASSSICNVSTGVTFDIAHDLQATTTAALMQDAREYALSLSAQRQAALARYAAEHPGTVAYSDLRCFTTAGRYDVTRSVALAPLLTRVPMPIGDTPATPHECVADEQQYVGLHQLMSTYIRDARMGDVADTQTRDTLDVSNDNNTIEDARASARETMDRLSTRRARSTRSGTAGGLNPAASAAAPDTTRRGRPKGARSRLTYARFVKAVKALALQADNALRAPNQFTRVTPANIHDPTDNWTRLTPLMPPAASDPLAQGKYGRALPVRAVNNQHVDSLLWRSLINAWLNHPTMRDTEAKRPPIVQITALRGDIMQEYRNITTSTHTPAEPIPYTSGSELALATVYIPIPAAVVHQWLTTGPTVAEVSRVLPATHPVPGGALGRYVDPHINPVTNDHQPTPMFPEVMLTKGCTSQPANDVPGLRCIPNPTPKTSWLHAPADLANMVDLSPLPALLQRRAQEAKEARERAEREERARWGDDS